LTAEQLEASRAERMRQNGHGALTLEDARTWIEETGLCLFLPRRQFSSSIAPSFVEAIAGERNANPDPRHIATAEELLVRLEADGVAVRLNLLGLPGEHPDFVVAAWVLPYVYALRGDRDWRRSPQLTGSRQVSPLATQAYKLLEAGDATIATLKHALGREVTEGAVLRAITELWQQLRIIPIVSAPGQAAMWQLLRLRFQKAIAEGASTSQVTAISVLASIYLQAVIAASMEEVELFLAPLTARSKVREVLRGLVATRQVHTISMGHAPHFYVAGTLPEFAVPQTSYSSSSMPAYFSHSRAHEDEWVQPEATRIPPPPAQAAHITPAPQVHLQAQKPAPEPQVPRTPAVHKPAPAAKAPEARPHFSPARRPSHARDRKPSASSSGGRPVRRKGSESRPSSARPASTRWSQSPSKSSNGNGTHKTAHSANGNGAHKTAHNGNGARSNGNGRATKPSTPAWSQRNGRSTGAKPAAKPTATSRTGSATRNGSAPRKDSRANARPVRGTASRKPTLSAGAKATGAKRFGFAARPRPGAKKRG
jgi:23S rRNA pseudouridine2605 synthase